MVTTNENPYPEHAKLEAVEVPIQAVGQFLESSPYVLAEYVTLEGHSEPTLMPAKKSQGQILAEFFDLDRSALEVEKRAMLAALSALND